VPAQILITFLKVQKILNNFQCFINKFLLNIKRSIELGIHSTLFLRELSVTKLLGKARGQLASVSV